MFPILPRVIMAFLLAISALPLLPAGDSQAASRVITYNTFNTDEPYVALTFDVTFDRGDGPQILNILRDRGVRATFAVTGLWAQDNPDLIQRIVNEGHHLINHTWDHHSMTGEFTGSTVHQPRDPLTRQQIINQLQRTEDLIRNQVGIDMRPYVRPPYGDYSDETLSAMADAGYTHNIMWTIDTLGWYARPVSEVTRRALSVAQPGANILMHVGHGATDGAALPGIIDGYRELGYDFATVEDFVDGDLATPPSQYFPQTGFDISGPFYRYWWRFGGLPVFGFPISAQIAHDDMTVQYFERARFELQPDTWAERYDIHLTRLGVEMAEGRETEHAFRPVQGESDRHCTYFRQTQKTLCGGFRNYWEDFGGLAIYGYPISQEFREVNPDTGETYIVQYFERQRFEWHPGEWPARHDVLLGRVGVQAMRERE
jgi:peptidoglycan/xylan/chitin deacetylase (PgdA/CDA1 family)